MARGLWRQDNPELSSDYHKLCAAYIAYKAADYHLALQYVQGMLAANYTSSLLLADIYLHQKQWDLAVLALKNTSRMIVKQC